MHLRSIRPRWTVRWLMIGIALIGAILWLAVTARDVWNDPNSRYVYHIYWDSRANHEMHSHPAPFFPRYWRRLLGRPWPGSYTWELDPPNRPRAHSVTYFGPEFSHRSEPGWERRFLLRVQGVIEKAGDRQVVIDSPGSNRPED